MLSFHQATKDRLLARVGMHEALDAIRQGQYADLREDEHGVAYVYRVCAVGCLAVDPTRACTVLSDEAYRLRDHALERGGNGWHYEVQLQWRIPALLARVADDVFETFSHTTCAGQELARAWPRRFVEAIPVEVELPESAGAYPESATALVEYLQGLSVLES